MKTSIFCLLFFFCVIDCINAEHSWKKYIQEESGKERLVIHRKKGKLYDKIIYVKFSQDSNRVAYTVKQDTRLLMVTDTIETEYENVSENTIAYSATGKRLVFVAKKDNRWYVIVDGKPETQIGNANCFKLLQFSPDEKRISYAACKHIFEDPGWIIIIDGKEDGLKYRAIMNNRFSPDNQRTVYIGYKENYTWVVVVDGVEDKIEMDEVLAYTPVFSPNSKHLIYEGNKGRHFFMVIDGIKGIESEGIGKGSPVFSTSGDSIGCMSLINNKWNLVINNNKIKEYNYRGTYNGFWSLKIIEDYFSIKPENRCPLLVNNLKSSTGFLRKVNTYTVPYPTDGGYVRNTWEGNQAKLENGMNFIGIEYKVSLYNYEKIYSDLQGISDGFPDSYYLKFYFNAHPGKVYTIKTGSSSSDFLICIYMGEKYVGIVDITESYLRE